MEKVKREMLINRIGEYLSWRIGAAAVEKMGRRRAPAWNRDLRKNRWAHYALAQTEE